MERIITIPHSGTRTLQQQIYLDRGGDGEMPDDRVGTIKHWHWTLHPRLIADFFLAGAPRHAHIPLRNPFDVADSWERRYKDGVDKQQWIVNEVFLLQAKFIRECDDMITVYKIEDLPVLRGRGPNPEGWPDPEVLMLLPRFVALRIFFAKHGFVRDLYSEYYSGEELWWL